MRVVYIDELFLLNFAVDYIILRLAAHFSALSYRRWRILLGAAAGGAYAVAAYFDARILSSLPIKLAAGAAIVLCAFGYGGKAAFVRRSVCFFVFSLLLGGAAYTASLLLGGDARGGVIAAPPVVRAVVIACALILGVCGLFSRGDELHAIRSSAALRIVYRGRQVELRALRDSGNMLRDPLDGSPVVVVEADALAPLLDADTLSLLRKRSSVEAVGRMGVGWRLIPCTTAAGSTLLAAFRPDAVYFDDAETSAVVAVSAAKLGTLPALVGDLIAKGERSNETVKKAS